MATSREQDMEKIANGQCASPYTTEYCPYCVDTCKASEHRRAVNELKDMAENGKKKED